MAARRATMQVRPRSHHRRDSCSVAVLFRLLVSGWACRALPLGQFQASQNAFHRFWRRRDHRGTLLKHSFGESRRSNRRKRTLAGCLLRRSSARRERRVSLSSSHRAVRWNRSADDHNPRSKLREYGFEPSPPTLLETLTLGRSPAVCVESPLLCWSWPTDSPLRV